MNTIPVRIQSIVEQCIDYHMRPLCILLDKYFRVKAWSGDVAYYGYDGITEGKDCRDSMLFLVGLTARESLQLRFIETPNARAAHVNLIANSDELILVLLDATEQRINHTFMQQKSNELTLMHAEQNKLIANLKRLEQEVEAKRRQAEHANRLKGQFIATMSHEFRTPLTSIMGYTSRLKQGDGLTKTSLRYLASVERGAQHLLTLVENLLDQSQIEVDANNITINPIATNVRGVVDKLFSMFEPLAEDKWLNLRLYIASELPQYLFLDEMRFRQILVNLISNAIKFTEQGSVCLTVNWAMDELFVCVEDTGKGIAEGDQERIFVAFEQLGKHHSGTGLGLSIVKHLVTAMGGKLALFSSLGSGSRFEISLPAKQVEADDGYQEELKRIRFREKISLNKVLIVEDEPDILELLQVIFREDGYAVLAASDGNEAIRKALSNQPDLILLDLNLPDMTGFEVIETLRNYDFNNPVFAQSAWISSEYKAKAIVAGCDEYLQKPLDVAELKALLVDYFITDSGPGMPIEIYQQLCQQFLGSLAQKHEVLQDLELSNTNNDWDYATRQDLHDYAHRLAGSAGLYGLPAIASTSKQLDQLMLDYNRLQRDDNTSELRHKISNTITLLARHIQQAISDASTDNNQTLS